MCRTSRLPGSLRLLFTVVAWTVSSAPVEPIKPVSAADPAPATVRRDEIVTQLRDSETRLQSLQVAYRYRSETLAAPDAVKRYLHVAYLIDETRSYAFHGNQRYFLMEGPTTAPVLEPDVSYDYSVLPNGAEVSQRAAAKRAEAKARAWREGRPFLKSTSVKRLHYSACSFDGQQFRRRFVDGAVEIENSSDWTSDQGTFPQDYLINVGRAVPDVFDPAASRADQRLSGLIEAGDFTVEADHELVDDAICVCLRSPQGNRLWLDPACGYAARRWDITDPATGLIVERRSNRELAEAAADLWLPRVCWRDLYGKPLGPAEYHNVPLFRYAIEVTSLTVNNVDDAVFRLEIAPGEQVFDSTILAADDSGVRQPLSYVMPADQQSIEHAIATALREREEQSAINREQSVIIWINLAILAVVCSALGWRRWRARS